MNVSASRNTHEALIFRAVEILRHGGVVAVPTDTLYGLAASAFNESAAARIFEIKGRPDNMAMPVLLADVSDMELCAVDVPDVALKLAERFWPGALTLVLKKSPRVPDVVTGGKNTVALRVPDHDVPGRIVRELGEPITGTSANRSGKPGLTTSQAVRDELGDAVDLIVEGDCPGGLASTVLDLTGERPQILRQGAVSAEDIEAACGTIFL
jgi:L-threonylcarbamoyladenylate synthase